MISRRLAAAAAVFGLALVSGCSTAKESGKWQNGRDKPAAKSAAVVAVVPAADTRDVPPGEPVVVTVSNGTLESVALSNDAGKQVAGTLAADRASWRSGEPLGYGKTYKVAVVASDAAGRRAETGSSFSTVKPANLTLPVFGVANGKNYGVGQPVVVRWDEPIQDKQAAEKALTVTTDPPVEGRWHWFDKQEVHWRPQAYWQPGTKVKVDAKVYGAHFGGGLYGQEDRTVSFAIGKSKIAIADHNTQMMTVHIDGQKVRDIPVSLGKGGSTKGKNGQVIDFWTRSGPHVVLGKQMEVKATSESFGIPKGHPEWYETKLRYAVHISGAGEYVHLTDWHDNFGKRASSHGCVNVQPANAVWFYENFDAGDIVDVRNTPVPLPARDGLGDWTIPWEQW